MNDVKYLYFRLQVQIKYRDTEGNQALRVLTDERQQTDEKELAVKESDVRVLGTFAAQSVSQLQARGRFGQARAMLSTYQGFSSQGSSAEARLISEDLSRMRCTNVAMATRSKQSSDNRYESSMNAPPQPVSMSMSMGASSRRAPSTQHTADAPSLPPKSTGIVGFLKNIFASSNKNPHIAVADSAAPLQGAQPPSASASSTAASVPLMQQPQPFGSPQSALPLPPPPSAAAPPQTASASSVQPLCGAAQDLEEDVQEQDARRVILDEEAAQIFQANKASYL